MILITTQQLHTVWQSFENSEDGAITRLDILCYIQFDDSTYEIFSCQQGIPDGNECTYLTDKDGLVAAIEEAVKKLSKSWGTPVQTLGAHSTSI